LKGTRTILLLILFMLPVLDCFSQELFPNRVKLGEMTLAWRFRDATADMKESVIDIEVTAPDEGWVKIGFNTSNSLRDTWFLQAAVTGSGIEFVEQVLVRQRKPVNHGSHKAPVYVQDLMGTEHDGKTSISFSLPRYSRHNWYHNIYPDTVYFILLEYSDSDSFDSVPLFQRIARVKL
jgi:hypothetical protein